MQATPGSLQPYAVPVAKQLSPTWAVPVLPGRHGQGTVWHCQDTCHGMAPEWGQGWNRNWDGTSIEMGWERGRNKDGNGIGLEWRQGSARMGAGWDQNGTGQG